MRGRRAAAKEARAVAAFAAAGASTSTATDIASRHVFPTGSATGKVGQGATALRVQVGSPLLAAATGANDHQASLGNREPTTTGGVEEVLDAAAIDSLVDHYNAVVRIAV